MKAITLVGSIVLLATGSFAQSSRSTAAIASAPHVPPPAFTLTARPPAPTNYHPHTRLFSPCCFFDAGFAGDITGDVEGPSIEYYPPYQNTIVFEHGDPDWMPSRFVNFDHAVRLGQRQAPPPPGLPTAAMVQQTLYLIQQGRIEAYTAAKNGSPPNASGAAAIESDPSPPSVYMTYADALALGAEQIDAGDNPPAPLGDVARENRGDQQGHPKPGVKIKQDADGNPIIVQKKPK